MGDEVEPVLRGNKDGRITKLNRACPIPRHPRDTSTWHDNHRRAQCGGGPVRTSSKAAPRRSGRSPRQPRSTVAMAV